jgi:hypothetical protein
MKHLLILLSLTVLAACGDGKADAARKLAEAQEQAAAEAAGTVPYLLDLQAFDLPLVVSLPDVTTPDADSTYGKAVWNEEFGQLRVKAGDHFGLTITEDAGNIARLKADLDRDMLRKHTILQERTDLLVYRSQFPDEDLVFIHFYQVLSVDGRSFIVEDMAEGRFNEADVARMVEAVRPSQAI